MMSLGVGPEEEMVGELINQACQEWGKINIIREGYMDGIKKITMLLLATVALHNIGTCSSLNDYPSYLSSIICNVHVIKDVKSNLTC